MSSRSWGQRVEQGLTRANDSERDTFIRVFGPPDTRISLPSAAFFGNYPTRADNSNQNSQYTPEQLSRELNIVNRLRQTTPPILDPLAESDFSKI